ncbi:MAG: MarR family transcriptional regulator [Parvularculaceae bacterium]
MSHISVMTEITKITVLDHMPPATRRFILQWGDMGSTWGVNRSVAQIHALLYIGARPMHAEEIAETLGIARSNVSNSLKELQSWKIIARTPLPGDRRDYFVAEADVWEMAMRIAAVRKQREIDPALETLSACLEEADGDKDVSDIQRQRLEDLRAFTLTMDRWYDQMLNVPTPVLLRMVKMGDKVVKLLGFGQKKKAKEKKKTKNQAA